ncbi:MAG: YfhO family protein, partial [Alphaproteobacteria bacterium]
VLLRSGIPMPARTPAFREVGRHGAWTLWQNPLAFPRAYTIERARFVAEDDTALATVRSPSFDPRAEVVLTGESSAPDPGDLVTAPTTTSTLREARIVRDEPEAVGIEVDVERPAVLVLTDPIAPGWTARIDGEPVTVLAANHLGRGVTVPAGRHRVDFAYRAPGLGAGLSAFAIGWGLVLAGAIVARRSSEPRRATSLSSTSP